MKLRTSLSLKWDLWVVNYYYYYSNTAEYIVQYPKNRHGCGRSLTMSRLVPSDTPTVSYQSARRRTSLVCEALAYPRREVK